MGTLLAFTQIGFLKDVGHLAMIRLQLWLWALRIHLRKTPAITLKEHLACSKMTSPLRPARHTALLQDVTLLTMIITGMAESTAGSTQAPSLQQLKPMSIS